MLCCVMMCCIVMCCIVLLCYNSSYPLVHRRLGGNLQSKALWPWTEPAQYRSLHWPPGLKLEYMQLMNKWAKKTYSTQERRDMNIGILYVKGRFYEFKMNV